MKHIFWLGILAAAVVAVVALWPRVTDPVPIKPVHASGIEYEEFSLSNGMQVVLIPNHRVAAVSHTLWLKVGAADDPVGQSGLAHYHEHLMFKGTPSVPSGEYSRIIEGLGGEFNAFTGADYTGYYVNIAKEHLERVMQLESDRMQNLIPTQEDYATELKVIIEERQNRTENSPTALWGEAVQASLFQHYPYRIPIIGWMHEIEALSAQQAKDFYARTYHAGNMVLVVAGDVNRAELQPLAEQYYGSIPAREANDRVRVSEPPHRAPVRLNMTHKEVEQPRWQRRYMGPSMVYGQTQHALPASLLSEWIGGGKNSLLYKELVLKQKIATAAYSFFSDMNLGPSQFIIVVLPRPGVSMQQIETAVDDVLARAKTQLITPDELRRIKTVFKAEAVYARDGLMPLAQYAGNLLMLDLPLSMMQSWPDDVQAVSAQHMMDAAVHLLQANNSVSAQLLPETIQPESEARNE